MPRPIRRCRTFCASWTFPWRSPLPRKNLEPRPDLVVVGNAMSRGNVELEQRARPAHSILFVAAVAARRISARQGSAGRGRNSRQDHDHVDAGVDLPLRRTATFVSDRRHRRKFRFQFSSRRRQALHSGRRRVRHRLLRQGTEVPALLSRLRDSDLGRIRSRRYLQRSRCGRDGIQATGESDSAPRTDRRLRWRRRRGGGECKPGTLSGKGILSGRALRRRPARELESHESAPRTDAHFLDRAARRQTLGRSRVSAGRRIQRLECDRGSRAGGVPAAFRKKQLRRR